MTTATIKKQKKKFGPVAFSEGGRNYQITAEVRHDDECGNGHNSFAITGTIHLCDVKGKPVRWESGGCLHEDIAKHFPELAPFIKWHLCSTDEPMHYVANTVYHAGDRDHNGLRKGEKRQIRNGKTGVLAWHLVAVDSQGNEAEVYEIEKYKDSEVQPKCNLRLEYRPWWTVGEGKERDLAAARSCAVWPDATDEELTAPGLKERLEARLPALMAEFRAAVESLGFTW